MRVKQNRVPDPTKIREGRVARGLTAKDLAEKIGVSAPTMYQYETGKITPSGLVMDRLVTELNLPLNYFFVEDADSTREINFRCLASTTKSSKETVAVKAQWLERIYCFLENYISFPDGNIPFVRRDNKKPLLPEEIDNLATNLRAHWGLTNGPISNVILLLEKQGMIVSRLELNLPKIDACSWRFRDKDFMLINSQSSTAARTKFSTAHELGHIYLRHGETTLSLQEKETEANQFAGAFLLPESSFGQEIMSPSLDHFVTLKRRWKISLQAMIYRAEALEILTTNQALYLRKQISARRLKKREPLDDILVCDEPVAFKQAINLLLENGVQTIADICNSLALPVEDVESLTSVPKGTFTESGKVVPLTLVKG